MRTITFSFLCVVFLGLRSSVFALRGTATREIITDQGSEGRDAVDTVDNRDLKQKWRTARTSTNKNNRKRRKHDGPGIISDNSNSNNDSNNQWSQRTQNKPCDAFCKRHHTPWCIRRNADFSVKGKCSWKLCTGCDECVKVDPCVTKVATTAYDALPENHNRVACPENQRDRINSLNFFDDDEAITSSNSDYSDMDCSCCYYGWWEKKSNSDGPPPCCVPFGSGPP